MQQSFNDTANDLELARRLQAEENKQQPPQTPLSNTQVNAASAQVPGLFSQLSLASPAQAEA